MNSSTVTLHGGQPMLQAGSTRTLPKVALFISSSGRELGICRNPTPGIKFQVRRFFQKEVKLLWAHHSFIFTAPECEKSSPRSPPATTLSHLCLSSLHLIPSWSHFAALHIDECLSKCHQRLQLLVKKITDFICNSLGKKEEFCTYNLSFPYRCHRQRGSWRPTWSRMGTFWYQSLSKSFLQPSTRVICPQPWLCPQKRFLISDKCVISKPYLMWWQHTSLCFWLCKHSCFVPLLFSFMFKIVPCFLCSLAYIPSLSQTVGNHILLPGFLGRGESRHPLCAPEAYGGKLQRQGCSAHTSMKHSEARLGGWPTGCKPTLLPDAAPLHSWLPHQDCGTETFLLLCSSWCISPFSSCSLSSCYLPQIPFAFLIQVVLPFATHAAARLRIPWTRAKATAADAL